MSFYKYFTINTLHTNTFVLKNHRYGIFDVDRPGVEDIQLSDLGVPADPMEVPGENTTHQQKQKKTRRSLPKAFLLREYKKITWMPP